MVRLRMTEQSVVNDLDCPVRAHYAPRDSKSHKVEQVMSSLNETCGDGRFSFPPAVDLLDTVDETELIHLSSRQWKKLE